MHRPPILVVMTRAPICGAVKTRLGREIGAVKACALYRVMTARLLRAMSREPRVELVLAVTPDRDTWANYAAWAAVAPSSRVGQGRGDLGTRMQRLFDCVGRGPLILVGTDIPFITRSVIFDAFRRLASADAVLGPAEDGGYWLVGLRRSPRWLTPFAKVRWSTEHALDDTKRNLARCRVAFAGTLFDIDSAADYRRYLSLHG